MKNALFLQYNFRPILHIKHNHALLFQTKPGWEFFVHAPMYDNHNVSGINTFLRKRDSNTSTNPAKIRRIPFREKVSRKVTAAIFSIRADNKKMYRDLLHN